MSLLRGEAPIDRREVAPTALPLAGMRELRDESDQPAPLYVSPPAGQRTLRIVALVDRAVVPAWIGETLARICTSNVAGLLSIVNVKLPPAPRLPWLIQSWLRVDATLGGRARIAGAPCRLHERLPEVAAIATSGREENARLVLDAAALETIRAFEADLLIGFGLPPADANLAALARHGAWFFERHATDPLRGGLRFLAPLWRGEAVTPGGLVVHMSDCDEPRWLAPSWSATSQLSFARNRAYQWLRIPAELQRVLRRLAAGEDIPRQPAPEFPAPGTLATCAFIARLCMRGLRRQLPRLGRVEHWLLGLRRSAKGIDPDHPDASGFTPVEAPAGRYWADPCLVHERGRDWLFVEEFPYATGRGRIAVAELGRDLRPLGVHTVLEEASHLSYPRVFAWRDAWYMSIESSAAQCLPLYRATDFPYAWEPVGDLLKGRSAVDGTLHFDGTHWFLFACATEMPFGYDKRIWSDLFVFWADAPTGPWHPHPANPIVTDVRCARPAGGLFVHEGRLIRPAQDCSIGYGYAVVFNEVLMLDTQNYAERPLGRIDPRWAPDLLGCHTYSTSGDLEVVDGKRLIRRAKMRA